ncbi:hypothetical protein FH972_006461 [Carpinus fangiana]|uniref:Alpha/beta hydrolase fold-3 domain-containing protein n=1 Tax=Carpinus fangiana TaxID=176857 RepID=A0A5N6QTC1_9ROSI|nr:hypothetical protein FH972_006461 [Carpinus fangiana]
MTPHVPSMRVLFSKNSILPLHSTPRVCPINEVVDKENVVARDGSADELDEAEVVATAVMKLYSIFFKFLLKHWLQNQIQSLPDESDQFGVTSRPDETVAATNPSFANGVATKDIHIDPFTSLSIRIFFPDSALNPPEPDSRPPKPKPRTAKRPRLDPDPDHHPSKSPNSHYYPSHHNSYGPPTIPNNPKEEPRYSYGSANDMEGLNLMSSSGSGRGYKGYSSSQDNRRRLPVMLQFHGGGWGLTDREALRYGGAANAAQQTLSPIEPYIIGASETSSLTKQAIATTIFISSMITNLIYGNNKNPKAPIQAIRITTSIATDRARSQTGIFEQFGELGVFLFLEK